MKRKLIILIILLSNLPSFSQTIADFFITVPDSSMMSLSKEKRKQILRYSSDNLTKEDAYKDLRDSQNLYAFDIFDKKNGYLRMIGAFEGQVQMCYWNLKNGNKLIAIYIEGCGPVCYIEQFDFYEYDGIKFNPINWKSIIPEIYNDFLGADYKKKLKTLKEQDILATLLFELPRNGKNIIGKWGNEDSQKVYRDFSIGDRMNLKWNDGSFLKGNIYWKK